MSIEEFEQEWYLSTDAAIKGQWYEKELRALKAQKRITRVPVDPALPVDTNWDLGMDDSTAIVFSQTLRTEIRIVDYYEASGEGIPHYAQVLKDRGYTYGEHWAPYDIMVRELGTGKTRFETAGNHGIRFLVCPQQSSVVDGINAVRLLLARCYFDEERTAPLLNALRNYKKQFNQSLKEFTGTPVHDWASHGADAFRTLAVRLQAPKVDDDDRDDYVPRSVYG
jgi:phage terminase large subunit